MAIVKLYHYTPICLFEKIYNSGLIKASRFIKKDLGEGAAISLTSDLDSSGHGLTEGLAFEGNVPENTRTIKIDGINMTLDARACRITLGINDVSSKLIKASEYYKNNMVILLALEARAQYPHNPEPSEQLLMDVGHRLKSGAVKGKGHTWWYFLGDLPYRKVLNVEERSQDGSYFSIFDSYSRN